MAETLVSGREFGIDSVVTDGIYQNISMREKILTPFPYRQCVGNIAVKSIEAINSHIQEVVGRLGLKNCFLNIDIVLKDDGSPFIIELAPRPAGHYLSSDFVEIVTGVNMIKEWLYFVQDKPYNFTPKFFNHAIIRYFDFEYDVIPPDFNKIKDELGIVKFKCDIKPGLSVVKDGKSIMSRGFAILSANSKEQCIKNADILMSKFKKLENKEETCKKRP